MVPRAAFPHPPGRPSPPGPASASPAAIATSIEPGLPCCDSEGCGGPLSLSQPDPNRPSRLLAVCHDCGAWWLLRYARSVRKRLVAPD